MFIDRYSRIVLTVIAVALSIIAVNPWIQPASVQAAYDFSSIESDVSQIQSDVSSISSGLCLNDKIC